MCLHRPIDVKYKLSYELEEATRAHPDYPGGKKNAIVNQNVFKMNKNLQRKGHYLFKNPWTIP